MERNVDRALLRALLAGGGLAPLRPGTAPAEVVGRSGTVIAGYLATQYGKGSPR